MKLSRLPILHIRLTQEYLYAEIHHVENGFKHYLKECPIGETAENNKIFIVTQKKLLGKDKYNS